MTVRRMRKDRKELGIVERPAIDVGKDLDPARPQTTARSISSSEASTLLSGSEATQAGNLSGRASQIFLSSSLATRARSGVSAGPAIVSIGGLERVSTCW